MLPISGDARVPMTEVYELFKGKATVDDVLKAARKGEPSPVVLENRLFYANLYLGLFFEAQGDEKNRAMHLTQVLRWPPLRVVVGVRLSGF